jgi:hypothetical protein
MSAGIIYDLDEYCFQDILNSGNVEWKPLLCASSHDFKVTLWHSIHLISKHSKSFVSFISNWNFSAIVVVILSFSSAIFVYIHLKQLNTTVGKLLFAFMVSSLVAFMTHTLLYLDIFGITKYEFFDVLQNLGTFSSFLWITVMAFDLWMSIR